MRKRLDNLALATISTIGVAMLGMLGFIVIAITGCMAQPTSITSPMPKLSAGQLFCELATANGPMVVGLIDATATAKLSATAAPVAIMATGMAAGLVQEQCEAAATAVGAVGGIPVSPPAGAVGNVAVFMAPSGLATSVAPATPATAVPAGAKTIAPPPPPK